MNQFLQIPVVRFKYMVQLRHRHRVFGEPHYRGEGWEVGSVEDYELSSIGCGHGCDNWSVLEPPANEYSGIGYGMGLTVNSESGIKLGTGVGMGTGRGYGYANPTGYGTDFSHLVDKEHS